MASTWVVVKVLDIVQAEENKDVRLVNFQVAGIRTDTVQVPDIDPFEDFVAAARQQIDVIALKYVPTAKRVVYDGFGFENPDAVAKLASRAGGRQ
ncbi:MAG: hypothetical protein EBR82_07165 [Caulobacteraceae bacterium]|nr:hypothetical protein [Caulobacteraceae bacterium]